MILIDPIFSPSVPPVLEPMPTILAVSRQDSAEFTCKTQAYPEPSIQWMFQGRQLVPNDPGIGIKELSNGLGRMESKLTVMNVTDRLYGAYRCYVRNNFGNISQEIILAKKCKLLLKKFKTADTCLISRVVCYWHNNIWPKVLFQCQRYRNKI